MPFELVASIHLKLRKPVMTNTTISIPVDDSTALASGLSGDDALNAAFEENSRDVARIGGS
jgi:hypothetical protein